MSNQNQTEEEYWEEQYQQHMQQQRTMRYYDSESLEEPSDEDYEQHYMQQQQYYEEQNRITPASLWIQILGERNSDMLFRVGQRDEQEEDNYQQQDYSNPRFSAAA